MGSGVELLDDLLEVSGCPDLVGTAEGVGEGLGSIFSQVAHGGTRAKIATTKPIIPVIVAIATQFVGALLDLLDFTINSLVSQAGQKFYRWPGSIANQSATALGR